MMARPLDPAKPRVEDIFGGEEPKIGAPVTETPEFKAALAEATAAVRKEIAAAMQEGGGAAPAPGDPNQLFAGLALAIAEMSHQGDKRNRPVDPKVMAERAAAQKQMDELLLETRRKIHDARQRSYASEEERDKAVRALSPKYRCIAKVHFGEQIIDPFRRDDATKRAVPIEFYWLQEPNDALRPLNPLAEEVYKLFRYSRGNRTEIEKKSLKPAWMSDHGLVIEGGAVPARRGLEVERPVRDENDLDIPHYVDPEAPFVNVIGTISDPAVQNHQGKPI